MSVKEVNGGYVIDFTLNHQRFRETIPAPHNKTASKRIEEQEAIYKMAISLNDKTIANRFANSKIIQKAFNTCCSYTIHDYSNIWFKQKQRNWSHTTIRGYTQKYNSYIKPNWGHLLLTEFKASMFDEWASESSLSGKSINETRNVIKQIFNRAFIDQIIDKDPTVYIERYKQETKEPKPFSQNEIKTILYELSPPYREYFQFAFYTGMRTGELIALRWEDIEIEKKLLHVRVNLTHGLERAPKTAGSARTIEIHPMAMNALYSLRSSNYANNRRVFVDPKTMNGFTNADGIRKYVWKPLLKKLNISYRYPYQTRHTYASMMLSDGKNPLWVAKQMGHSDWGMIRKIYGRWLPIEE